MELPVFGCHDYLWQGDSLLFLKDFYHLYIYDVQAQRFVYNYEPYLESDSLQAFLQADGQKRTTQQVQALNAYRDNLRHLLNEPDNNHDVFLRAYCQDWQGGEWFGLEAGGIYYRKPSLPVARTLPLGATASANTSTDVRFMASLGNQQFLTAGQQGIYVYNLNNEQFTALLERPIDCTNMHFDALGGLWISTFQGLFHYNDGQLTTVAPDQTTGFQHSHMRFAVPIQPNRLLVCNLRQQLGYFDLTSRHFDCLNGRLPQLDNYRVMIDALPYDKKGTMLVITQNGAFLLDTQNDSVSPLPEAEQIGRHSAKYNCALRDSKGVIWLGTQNGLFWLVPQLTDNGMVKDYTLHRTTSQEGLSNNCIRSMVEDVHGNLWVGTSYGVNCLKFLNDSLRVIPLLQADGIPGVEMFERAACTTEHGLVCFLSSAGLTIIDSGRIRISRQVLETCPVGLQARAAALPLGLEEYALAYNEFPLEMKFSALNYASPEHTHYRYKMDGLHDDWQYDRSGKGLSQVVFNTLAPGNYIFRIQSTLDHGNWGPETAFRLVVSPPWWWSWWAIALYVIVGVALLVAAMARYLQYRRQQLERLNEARVNQLFELQQEVRHNFAQHVQQENKKLDVQNTQPELAERMTKCIADNIDNEDYTIDTLARDLAMSRSSLYKKTQEELGITPSDFMRNIRLKHSVKLLEQGIPVNKVALMVGFQTSYYFSKCFKKMFGVNPSQFHHKKGV